jgi:hypothetical protein
MAQAAEKLTRLRQASLSRAQRRKIRGWRSDLGHAIWNLNESPLAHELRRQYDLQQRWNPDDMMKLSEGIETTVLIALEIRKELAAFVKRGGRMRKDAKEMPKQYLDRLKGALEGIWLGVGYLRKLMPDNLSQFIEETLGENWELAEMLFFGFCPIVLEAGEDLPVGRRLREAEKEVARRRKLAGAEAREEIEQLKAREQVAKKLDLKGMAREAATARRDMEKLMRAPYKETQTIAEKGGCYNNGLKALRASVMQMFYTMQTRDVSRVQLNDEDSDNWHSWQRDVGEPPSTLTSQLDEAADEEGRVLHVFDKEQNLVYVATPKWYVGEDPDSLAKRSSLKKSRGARTDWNYDYRQATPADAAELHRSLTPAERKRVSAVLNRYAADPQTGEARGFTLEEIASMAEVPFRSVEQAEFQRKSAKQFGRNPEGADVTTQIGQDSGLISALWKMDLD